MKNKSTKRALISSAIALVVCIAMLVGTTFAWFTDNVSSANNIIKSGNLDVELYYSVLDANGNWTTYAPVDENTKIFNYEKWEPGYTSVAKFQIKNNGSLALKYQLSADVISETEGVNKDGQSFKLSEFLKYGVTSVIDAIEERDLALAIANNDFDSFNLKTSTLAQGASDEVGVVIAMPTTVGNEANHNGIDIPTIQFGINLLATQSVSESDSFGNNYDALATFENGVHVIDDDDTETNVNDDNTFTTTNESGTFKTSGTTTDGKEPVATIDNTAKSKITVEADGKNVLTYDIKVTDHVGDVTVELYVGKGLRAVKVYHEGTVMSDTEYDYNSLTGFITFVTDDFSIFDIAFVDASDNSIPFADVSIDHENIGVDIECISGWSPLRTINLDSAYKFVAVDTEEDLIDNPYASWHADFVCKLSDDVVTDKESGKNIGIAGAYGTWGWLGFDAESLGVTELPGNTEFRLLKDFREIYIDYYSVCTEVKEFRCGAFNDGDCGKGVTLTVELRLYETKDPADTETNTANEETGKYITIGKYEYTF